MIASTSYADAFFGVPGGVYRMDARRLGAGYEDGAPVQYLPDLLGQGRAFNDVLAQRVTFNASGNWMDYEGATKQMRLPESALVPPSDIVSIFSVVRYGRVAPSDDTIVSWANSAGGRVWHLGVASNNRPWAVVRGTSIVSPNNSIAENNSYILSLLINESANTVTIWRGNTQIASGTVGTATVEIGRGGGLGARPVAFPDLTDRWFRGIMGVSIYRGIHAHRDAATIRQRLSQIHGVAI